MIHDHGDFVALKCPAAWGLPPFHLGQRVYAGDTDHPGIITGMSFCRRAIASIGEKPGDEGWYFEIEIDPSSPLACINPRDILFWTEIQPFHSPVQSRYELAVAV